MTPATTPTDAVEVLDVQAVETLEVKTDEWDLTWVPSDGDATGLVEEYYEAESWQFSGCGD